MNMNKKLLLSGVIATSAFMMLSSGANAALSVYVSNGTTNTTIGQDAYGQVSFNDGLFGSVLFSDWDVSITAKGDAYYDLINSGANYDQMHYDSVDVKAGNNAGTLTIMFTETGLMKGNAGFMAKYGGVFGGIALSGDNVQFESFVDASNTAFGLSQSVANSGLMNTSTFSNVESGTLSITGPYSWTTVATITQSQAGQSTSFNYEVKIPEPSTVALLGLGVLGLGFAARRKRREAGGVAA